MNYLHSYVECYFVWLQCISWQIHGRCLNIFRSDSLLALLATILVTVRKCWKVWVKSADTTKHSQTCIMCIILEVLHDISPLVHLVICVTYIFSYLIIKSPKSGCHFTNDISLYTVRHLSNIRDKNCRQQSFSTLIIYPWIELIRFHTGG